MRTFRLPEGISYLNGQKELSLEELREEFQTAFIGSEWGMFDFLAFMKENKLCLMLWSDGSYQISGEETEDVLITGHVDPPYPLPI